MLPLVVLAVGGYLVYDSLKKPVKDYADGGKIDVTKLKKGDEITINMGDGNEKVKVLSNFKAGVGKLDFISLGKTKGAPYTLTLSKLEKVIVMADGGMMADGGKVDARTYLHINKKNDSDVFPLIDDGYYVKLSKHKEVFLGGQILKDGMIKTEAINFAKDLMSSWNIPDENLIIDEEYRVKEYADGGMMAKGGSVNDDEYLYCYDCEIKGSDINVLVVWADSIANARDICEREIGNRGRIKDIKKTKIKTSKNGVDLDNVQWEKRYSDITKTYGYKLLVDGFDGLYVRVEFRYAIGSGYEIRYSILGKKVSDYSFDSVEEAKSFAIDVLKERLQNDKIKKDLIKEIKEWKKDNRL